MNQLLSLLEHGSPLSDLLAENRAGGGPGARAWGVLTVGKLGRHHPDWAVEVNITVMLHG